MKSLIFFVLGVASGIAFMWYGPDRIQDNADQAVQQARYQYEVQQHDRCVAEFLRESSCLRQQSARDCDQQAIKKCGVIPNDPNPSPKAVQEN